MVITLIDVFVFVKPNKEYSDLSAVSLQSLELIQLIISIKLFNF